MRRAAQPAGQSTAARQLEVATLARSQSLVAHLLRGLLAHKRCAPPLMLGEYIAREHGVHVKGGEVVRCATPTESARMWLLTRHTGVREVPTA